MVVVSHRQVSGEILLGCRWRITPLDEIQLKVKACQYELEQKEELLALLHEHLQLQNAAEEGNLAGVAPVVELSEAQKKRLHRLVGTLDVKVIWRYV